MALPGVAVLTCCFGFGCVLWSVVRCVEPCGGRVGVVVRDVIVWSTASRPDLRRFNSITAAYPVPGTDLLLVAAGGGALHCGSALVLAERSSGEIVHVTKLDEPLDAVLRSAVDFDPSTSILVARTTDGAAHVYRITGRTLAKVVDLSADTGPVTAARLDPLRHRILLARGENLVAIALDELTNPSSARSTTARTPRPTSCR